MSILKKTRKKIKNSIIHKKTDEVDFRHAEDQSEQESSMQFEEAKKPS